MAVSDPRVQLHYEVHQGNGPYLLMVHGMLSSRAQWMHNIGPLAAVCRPVVAELWAHGRSPSPEDTALYAPGLYVQEFDRIRAELGAERWFVCGQSFGAALTLRYGLDYAPHIIGQIFTNSLSAMANAEAQADYRRRSKDRVAAIAARGYDALLEMPIHASHARRLPEDVKQALVADSEMLNLDGLSRTFVHTSPYVSVASRIRENTLPTLMVVGEREKRFTPHREFAEANVPHLQVAGFEAGHAVNIQAADGFNTSVAAFIKHLSAMETSA